MPKTYPIHCITRFRPIALNTLAALMGMGGLSGCMVNLDVGVGGGESVVITENRDLGSFSRIQVGQGIKLSLVHGYDYSARITTDDYLVDDCFTRIHNGTLEIGWSYAANAGLPAEVVVTSPYLTSVQHNGDGDVFIEADFGQPDLRLELNGSGNLTFRGDVGYLAAVVNGSGILELFGYADDLFAQVNGSGALYADPLLAGDATALMAGSGDLTLALDRSASLDLTVSGSGHVEWWGNPSSVKYRMSGSGKVVENRVLLKKGSRESLPRRNRGLEAAKGEVKP